MHYTEKKLPAFTFFSFFCKILILMMTTIWADWKGKRIKIANGMSLWRQKDISIKRHLVFIG
jgi:hypothetical protein